MILQNVKAEINNFLQNCSHRSASAQEIKNLATKIIKLNPAEQKNCINTLKNHLELYTQQFWNALSQAPTARAGASIFILEALILTPFYLLPAAMCIWLVFSQENRLHLSDRRKQFCADLLRKIQILAESKALSDLRQHSVFPAMGNNSRRPPPRHQLTAPAISNPAKEEKTANLLL